MTNPEHTDPILALLTEELREAVDDRLDAGDTPAALTTNLERRLAAVRARAGGSLNRPNNPTS